jgi:hypothetical protein
LHRGRDRENGFVPDHDAAAPMLAYTIVAEIIASSCTALGKSLQIRD